MTSSEAFLRIRWAASRISLGTVLLISREEPRVGGGRLARRGCGRADHAVAAWSGHRRIYGRRPLVRRCYLTLHKERHRCLACRDEHPHRLPPLTPMPPTLQRQGAAHYGPARRRFSRRQQLATVPRAAAPTTGSSSPRPRLPLCDNTLLMVNFRQPRVLVIHWFRLWFATNRPLGILMI
jgi:hypothetical protein